MNRKHVHSTGGGDGCNLEHERQPQNIAESIFGGIDWIDFSTGFARCPGEHLHSHRTGKRDCRVNLDGAPTLFVSTPVARGSSRKVTSGCGGRSAQRRAVNSPTFRRRKTPSAAGNGLRRKH